MPRGLICFLGASTFLAISLHAQQPIGRTSAQEVKVSGAMDVHNGEMLLGNGSAVTAGDQAVKISLTRGGELRLCPTTTVHLSRDGSVEKQDSSALMMALDRGALEANYSAGKYSDVLMTPDFRILVSGPGTADLSVRVNAKGDTCVDNHGANAPYVTVSSLFDSGVYRVQPNQRVLFEHGSLHDVVDSEKEICGCPAPVVSLASSGTTSNAPASPGAHVGGPSSTAADTTFPLAVSQGLAAPPAPPPTTSGDVHASVTVPLTYNGTTGKAGDPAELAAAGAAGVTPPPTQAPAAEASVPVNKPTETATAVVPEKKQQGGGFFHSIGHFFSRIFGK
jgi:hypothetical protein